MQKRVHEEVVRARERSGWPARRTLGALGVSRRSYYRWLKDEQWAKAWPAEPVRPVQLYEALPAEKEAVLAYARAHRSCGTGSWPGGWWTRTWRA